MNHMHMITNEGLAAAERFLWTSARLIDRLRFGHLNGRVPAARVVDAVRPYQNDDGGFGEAIEPDFRGPVSQPVGVLTALAVVDEVGAFDHDLAGRACDYLASITTPEGGVPFVVDTVDAYPRAPWWQPQPGVPACLLPTASLAGLMHANDVFHLWLEPATRWCWPAIDELGTRAVDAANPIARMQIGYEARAAVTFLDRVPDRARATAAADRLGEALLRHGLIDTTGDAGGEADMPLDFAPHPSSLARRWFDDAAIDRNLAALTAAQEADGGWSFPWEAWTPITVHEWRGAVTVERLLVLAAYDRVQRV